MYEAIHSNTGSAHFIPTSLISFQTSMEFALNYLTAIRQELVVLGGLL
ncbi:MAG: hypothetical protein ACO3O3_04970 [Ilumatobacteraceae bacterium]